MGTTYLELKQRVLLSLQRADGTAELAVSLAINRAQKYIARAGEFDELKVLDTTNAETVADQKTYHLVDDFGLTRPKDIYTIRYMDESNSRKLTYIHPSELDEQIPYPEQWSSARPKWYTRRGNNIELIPIPNEAKSVYIYYSQWAVDLSADTDETVFSDIDDVLVALAREISAADLEGGPDSDWTSRAGRILSGAVREDTSRPDQILVARPFSVTKRVYGEYWKDPTVKREP